MAEKKPFTGVDDRVPLAKAVPLEAPFTLNIFPSNICNFRCNYCAQSLGKDELLQQYRFGQEQMQMEILEQAVKQAKEWGVQFKLVSFMGHGEPLCNRRLPEMIRTVKQAGIAKRVDVITNASLLNKQYSDELLDAGLDVLRVSLQGVTADSYREICGVTIDFERFVKNLTYFYKNRGSCKVYLKTVDAALKDGEEETFYKLFSPIADRIYIDKVKPVYDGVFYTDSASDLSCDRYGNVHERRLVCPQPFYMMSVWANGDVTPCDALYKACPLGNVMTDTLEQMWKSEAKKQFCRMHLEKKKNTHPACKKCCAPDDVASKEDVLDDAAEELMKKYS
jgi:radical SAM protein with 4Fe4S-binding SPASM domain